jgi:dihydrofolate reductase
MGKVVVINHVTLDGVMQGPGRADEDLRGGFTHGGWGRSGGSDPVLQQIMGAHMGTSWSLLVGRRTYEDFAGFWPHQPEPNPFGAALTKVQKYVASTTLTQPLGWENSTLLEGDVAAAVGALRRQANTDLVVFGSGELVRTLRSHGLVDEYLLMIHPLVLGSGRRLFDTGGAGAALQLVDATSTDTGVLAATYRPVQSD